MNMLVTAVLNGCTASKYSDTWLIACVDYTLMHLVNHMVHMQ